MEENPGLDPPPNGNINDRNQRYASRGRPPLQRIRGHKSRSVQSSNHHRQNQDRAQSLNRHGITQTKRGTRGHSYNRGMHRNGAHGSHQSLMVDMGDNPLRPNISGPIRADKNRYNRNLGFKAVEDIALSDPRDILGKVNERKESFFNLISKPVEADLHVFIVQILSKSCLSSFDELKLKLLLDVCNSGYIMYLTGYLMALPYVEADEKKRNRFYWNNQNDFWRNLITFYETIFTMAPSVAMQKCRSLVEMSLKLCLEELKIRHGFEPSKENSRKLNELHEMVSITEKKNVETKQKLDTRQGDDEDPPESFRQLSVIPKRDQLFEERPYLRANVVHGGYRDVEHYLDVQFRLLREDCFGPLREGLLQYIEDPNKNKYDNMRVYRNVKFIGPYVSNLKCGLLVQLDENAQRRQKRINWAHNKRFIFGSLLLFSKDNCNNFIIATILDRNIQYLSEGVIPISIVDNAHLMKAENIIENQESYVMFESEVYFEPYYHVLKVFQDPSFPNHIAMSKYIVEVEPTPRPPQYLQANSIFSVETLQSPDTKFRVLNESTWPSHQELQFNESQFEAYQLALTQEFAVIQGPPGTGKTYLGVRVAKTLLENVQCTSSSQCFMLIICYTNHALDQFLEHILHVTKSIVRIGAQSRNPAMEALSLNNLRRNSSKQHSNANSLYYSEKQNLKTIMGQLQMAQQQINALRNGILAYDCMCDFVPELEPFFSNFPSEKDKLMEWLLQNVNYEVDTNIEQLLTNAERKFKEIPIDSDDINDRTAFMLDDLSEEFANLNIYYGIEAKTVFLLHDANEKIDQGLKQYIEEETIKGKELLRAEILKLYYVKSVFEEMRQRHQARGVPRTLRDDDNVLRLPNEDRWAIYFTYANIAINEIRKKIEPLQEEFRKAEVTYEEARMNLDLHLLEKTKVVGMTTSGAARLRKLLKALAPPIVIVEEAAEVLEQHIVASLTKHCQHLILIGDHQQLRPSAAYMRLARHFDIEVSLFERMILNNIHSRRLRVQHRMRPEISALIAPHIYSDLQNHQSVEAFPRVRGITANLFFFTHNYMEKADNDSASRSNPEEADMVLGLANYLMQQGYEPEDITILAAYSGQMFYLKKEKAKYVFLNKVKTTVVDNYQGEESKIILLSLVRNNAENRIGFLGTENRICVALSRAKEGFYMFGNIDILKRNSELWGKISKTLENGGYVGPTLRLRCENHPQEVSTISTLKDFEKVPEGGCHLMCNRALSACGHPCPQICHGYDRGHSMVKCPLKCERVICELGHVCPLRCAAKCRPCAVKVRKLLPCGHEMLVPCHQDPADQAVKCLTVVSVRLPHCGHEANKQCYINIKMVECMVPCAARVEPCGHKCRRRCHVSDDPDHEKYICEKPCARAKKGCTAALMGDRGHHQCPKACHEACDPCDVEVFKKRSNCKHSQRIACSKSVDENICRQNCARMLPCGHFCKRKCFEKCGDCDQMVNKEIPECGHTVKVKCREQPERKMCGEACERTLACGHACAGRCARACDATPCVVLMPTPVRAPCGHEVRLPCALLHSDLLCMKGRKLAELLLKQCKVPCGAILRCGHACAGSCGKCLNGRLHAPCASRCHVTNICGHQCEEPCNQVCPPCQKKCKVKCPHSKCSKLCGAPCIPCQEPCTRRCPHGACSRRCGEPCSRAACEAACARRLRCGHACRGLCGEPCPPVCAECRPDDFPRDFLGDDFGPDAKFIQLQDCSHILEVEDADNLMNGDKETISIRACPFCRKPIINTYRYKDRVNEMYTAEINPIKERVYGTVEQVHDKKEQLIAAFNALNKTHVESLSIRDLEHFTFRKAFKELQTIVRTQRKMSLLQLHIYFLYINIMEMVGDKIQQYKQVKNVEFKDEFLGQIRIICQALVKNIEKISQQQQEDISNEIKRMGSIIQLSKIFGHGAYVSNKDVPNVKKAAETAKNAVLSLKIYKEDEVMAALKELQKEIKVSGIVTKEERELIVRAIGLKQGHWYKCPNGHFYCIGECGGAMQISKCIECGARIGGQSHNLLSDNSHAAEMDGSRFAAWSEEANNMANFDLNDL